MSGIRRGGRGHASYNASLCWEKALKRFCADTCVMHPAPGALKVSFCLPFPLRQCGYPDQSLSFISSGNVMLLMLVTNEEKNFPGFRANYSPIPQTTLSKSNLFRTAVRSLWNISTGHERLEMCDLNVCWKKNATAAEILRLPNVSEITVIIFQSVHNNNSNCVKGQI